jgi:hypothetical protein
MPVIEVPAQVVQATATAARESVMNKGNLHKFDRTKMPLMGLLSKRKKEEAFSRGKVLQLLQRDGGLDLQLYQRSEIMDFAETYPEDEMVWDPYRVHMGLTVTHADLEDRGLSVSPNDGNTNGPSVSKIPKAAGEVLFDYFAMQMEDMRDGYDVRHDELLHLDGSQDPLAPAGLDGLLPLDNTVGTIGGKDRSDALFRHVVISGSTVGAGGTLERDLQRGVRLAEEYTRGMPSSVDTIVAGDDWFDAYVDYAKANGLRYWRDLDSAGGVDIGTPDSNIHWNGIKIIRDPTMRRLDAEGKYTGTPWAKRAYFLSSANWELAYQKGKDKKFRTPVDPSDQFISRFSLYGRYALICKFPRGQFVSTIA